jgi:hypothetical protein
LTVVRGIALFHSFIVVVGMGVGLPLIIAHKMLQLRRENGLVAESVFAGLFEWYSLNRPYVRHAERGRVPSRNL